MFSAVTNGKFVSSATAAAIFTSNLYKYYQQTTVRLRGVEPWDVNKVRNEIYPFLVFNPVPTAVPPCASWPNISTN